MTRDCTLGTTSLFAYCCHYCGLNHYVNHSVPLCLDECVINSIQSCWKAKSMKVHSPSEIAEISCHFEYCIPNMINKITALKYGPKSSCVYPEVSVMLFYYLVLFVLG